MGKPWLGIDFGTWNSSAAIRDEEGRVELVRRSDSDRSLDATSVERTKEFPSFVLFDSEGAVLGVGASSKGRAPLDPEHVVWGIKRLLGKTYSELKQTGELDRYPFRIRPDRTNGQCVVMVGEKAYTPVQICSEILKRIKRDAEAQLAGRKIDSAVVSFPAYFDPVRVTPLVEAIRQAGFHDCKTVPEPVAAALSYHVDIYVRPTKVLVFDLGAGTLDVTTGYMFRDPEHGDEFHFQVAKNTGDPRLGGIDMDDRLVSLIKERCEVHDLSPAEAAMLRARAEEVKIELSRDDVAEGLLMLGGKEYHYRVDRVDLAIALQGKPPEKNILEECRRQIASAIQGAGWTPEEVELLIVIGGPTRLWSVHDMLRIAFHSNPVVLEQIERFYSGDERVDAMTAVSMGAANLVGRSVEDRVPYGHGIEVTEYDDDEITLRPCMLVPRDSPYPYRSAQYRLQWYTFNGLFEFKIVQQVPESELAQCDHEYRFVGIQRLAVKNPRSAVIAVQMGYNDNKELEVSLRNLVTTESAFYVGFSQFNCIGMDYPMVQKRPPNAAKSTREKQTPSLEARQAFVQWTQALTGFLRRKVDAYPVPQMFISQMLDELTGLLSGREAASECEAIYTKANTLLWNANSRGLLTHGEYSEFERRLSEHEGSLFVAG